MKEQTVKKGRVFSNSIIYAVCGLLIKGFSFFLLPVYTAYLSTDDYGITSVVSSFLTTMSFIVALSLYSAVLRFYVDYKNDKEKLKRFYGTIVSFVFLMGVAVALLLYFFRSWLMASVFRGVDFYPIVLIALISMVFFCQQHIYENILKSQQKAKKYGVFSICYFLFTVSMNILFVVKFKMGVVGVVFASMLGYIAYFAFSMIDMMRNDMIRICIDGSILKDALKYSIPIIPHNLSTQLAMLISKILIGGTSSLGAVGVYSIASQFGNMADTIQTYSDSAYSPWLFETLKSKEDGYKDTIRKISQVFTAILGLFFIGISLFAQDYIVLFLNKSYVAAWKMVPLIVCVFVIKIMYYFYVGVLFYYKNASRLLFTATISSSLINIIISYIAIPIGGVYGSIFADACAMIIRVLIVVCVSKKFEDVGLRIGDFVKRILIIMFFIFAGLALSYTKFTNEFSIINFVYKCIIVLLYLVSVMVPYKKSIKLFIKDKKIITSIRKKKR